MIPLPPTSTLTYTLFPYTTRFRSSTVPIDRRSLPDAGKDGTKTRSCRACRSTVIPRRRTERTTLRQAQSERCLRIGPRPFMLPATIPAISQHHPPGPPTRHVRRQDKEHRPNLLERKSDAEGKSGSERIN